MERAVDWRMEAASLREWPRSSGMSRSCIARTVNTETQKTSGVIVAVGTHRLRQTIMIFAATEKGEHEVDRLISLDELNKFPIRLDHYDKEHGSEVFVLGIESVLEYAEYLPTVDAVPVTRCKDCVHWQEFNDDLRRDGMCEALLNFHGAERNMTNEDFFCSYGERRTDAK